MHTRLWELRAAGCGGCRQAGSGTTRVRLVPVSYGAGKLVKQDSDTDWCAPGIHAVLLLS